MNNWKDVMIVPEFDEQGVACYKLEGGDYLNEYYIVSEAESRKLLKQVQKEHTFWTDGYFACSVGNVSEEMLKRYIENQG